MSTPDNSPILDDELLQIFRSLEHHPRIAIGVSGGADSMALMYLLKRWCELRPLGSHEIVVMSVDHDLRVGSIDEALWVGGQAGLIGLKHLVLQWRGRKPGSGVQAAARAARYGLMIEAGRKAECMILVVGHHMDDQAETLLMRLARGSGVDGLSAMAPMSLRDGFALHRPFLDIPKSRLKASLVALGREWIEDPSNENEDFERVRVRKEMASGLASGLAQGRALGLSAQSLSMTARRLERARLALNDHTSTALADLVEFHDGAFGEILADGFFSLPEEIRLRVLGEVVLAFGGRAQAPQLSKLEKLLLDLDEAYSLKSEGGAAINEMNGRHFSGSLGGALIKYRGAKIRIYREPGRGDISTLPIGGGGAGVIWDERFKISVSSSSSSGERDRIFIGPLGQKGLATLKELGLDLAGMPSEALGALPSVMNGQGKLLGVPHLKYWSDGGANGEDALGFRVIFEFVSKNCVKSER